MGLLSISLGSSLSSIPARTWLTPTLRRLQHRIYWSHRRTDDLVAGPGAELGPAGPSEHVAFQRMAHHAGLAYLDEVCGCLIGHWLAGCLWLHVLC